MPSCSGWCFDMSAKYHKGEVRFFTFLTDWFPKRVLVYSGAALFNFILSACCRSPAGIDARHVIPCRPVLSAA